LKGGRFGEKRVLRVGEVARFWRPGLAGSSMIRPLLREGLMKLCSVVEGRRRIGTLGEPSALMFTEW